MRARDTSESLTEPLLLDVTDVQEVLRVGRKAALDLMHRAGPVRIGRLLRVRVDDLRRVVAELRREPAVR